MRLDEIEDLRDVNRDDLMLLPSIADMEIDAKPLACVASSADTMAVANCMMMVLM